MIAHYDMTWGEVYDRLTSLGVDRFERIYGVPRGGSVCAGLTFRAVDSPGDADLILDDIVDSGRTRTRYKDAYPHLPFLALVDRQGADKHLEWVVFPWEGGAEQDGAELVTRMLEFIGEDPNREGLKETPGRVVRSWGELFSGYGQDPAQVMKVFEDGACDEMVVVRDIDFYSTCEHHMLPFYGRAHVAYVPHGKIIGLSKVARLVDMFARRLQVQEQLTAQVADALYEGLECQGVAVILEGRHLCMCARGVQKYNGVMTTSALRGNFREDAKARSEFLTLCDIGRSW